MTDTTSCNSRNTEVRQQSKKTGKIGGKSTEQPEKPVGQVVCFMCQLHGK